MDSLLGHWKFDVDNTPDLIEYLEVSGYPKEVCTKEKAGDIKMAVLKKGDIYEYHMEFPGSPPNVCKFKPGQPFDLIIPNGLTLRTTFIIEGTIIIQKMLHEPSGKEAETILEPNESKLKIQTTMEGKSLSTYLVRA